MNDPQSSLLENGDLEVWFGDEAAFLPIKDHVRYGQQKQQN